MHSAIGAMCFDDNGGFVLQTSTPNFPDPSYGNTEFVPLGCQRDNNIKFAQHFFAFSTTNEDLVKLGESMQSARLCSANMYPDMKELLLSPSLQQLPSPSPSSKVLSVIAQALNDANLPVQSSQLDVVVKTRQQQIPVHVVVKSKKNEVPPWYEMV